VNHGKNIKLLKLETHYLKHILIKKRKEIKRKKRQKRPIMSENTESITSVGYQKVVSP
jgi:ribosomal protein L35